MTSPRGERTCGLVADDDALIRLVMRCALEDHGVAVVEASSGAEAIKLMESAGRVDFAVVDARMPGLTTAETIAGLRAPGWLPVLVISGSAPAGALPDGVEYLSKPLELATFLVTVDRLIAAALHRGS